MFARRRSHAGWVLVFCTLALVATPIQAAILVDNAKGWKITAPNWAVSLGASVHVHSEGGSDQLLIEIDKNFTGEPDRFGVFPSIILQFDQVAADDATASSIVVLDEAVSNNTVIDWTDYHFVLFTYGIANFDRDATFPSDADPDTTLDDFYVLPFMGREWEPDIFVPGPGVVETLSLFDGIVPQGDQFSPGGGPNGGELVINVDLSGDDMAHFGFKELPTPEPTTATLLILGCSALVTRRRRRA